MRNIFLVYMPPNNPEAMLHYRETIQERVPFARIRPFIRKDDANKLKQVFADRPIAVWGSRDSSANRSKFDKMVEGDDLLIVEGDTIKFMGKVALKTVNPDLSRELWKNIDADRTDGWDLIYFIANAVEIGVAFAEFCKLFGYEQSYQLRGFTVVSKEKCDAFFARYDDLYSILIRLRAGLPVEVKMPSSEGNQRGEDSSIEVEREDIEEVLRSPLVSDHAKMQWKLASLGIKAGEKVWVPIGDQAKLRRLYEFTEFETQFAAGIDLPKNYFENIDVVWKEEYRIDAAFEVENSTAIYSGLLRFADLNIIAPNTTYPMFIVAPGERRNRVREQLRRPVFKRLDLRDKVKFLSYETINDIDRFFATTSSGLSVDLIGGRAETLT